MASSAKSRPTSSGSLAAINPDSNTIPNLANMLSWEYHIGL